MINPETFDAPLESKNLLSLLALTLAFTFWLAAPYFDAAQQSLLNEANAIRKRKGFKPDLCR